MREFQDQEDRRQDRGQNLRLCVARDLLERPERVGLAGAGEAIESLQKEIRRCHKKRGKDVCALEVSAPQPTALAPEDVLEGRRDDNV